MKILLLVLLIGFPLFATDLVLKEGFVAAHTEQLMDSTINPLNNKLNADVKMQGSDVTSLSGKFWIEMNLFVSDNEKRDKNMNETIEVTKYPLATYTIKSVIKAEGDNAYTINGIMDFHGAKKDLSFVSHIVSDGDGTSISAKAQILGSDYGLKMPCMFFMCVRDEIDLAVEALF